jgi:hypothetical protein
MSETEIDAKIRSLPDSIKGEVLNYIDFLLSKYYYKEVGAKGFKFDWEGGLADLKKEFSSVELQHKASEWR